MDYFSYPDSPYPIRDDIKQAYRDYWPRPVAGGAGPNDSSSSQKCEGQAA